MEKYSYNEALCSPENEDKVLFFLYSCRRDGVPPQGKGEVRCLPVPLCILGGVRCDRVTYVYIPSYEMTVVRCGMRLGVIHKSDFDRCIALLSKKREELTEEELPVWESLRADGFSGR